MADVLGKRLSEAPVKDSFVASDVLYVVSSTNVSYKITVDEILTYTFSEIDELNGGSF